MDMDATFQSRAGAGAAWRAALAAVILLAAGCGSSDPNKPLTADQGASLLRGVRNDPSRVQNLTPAEKVYLNEKMKR
jgi:hypothetical protein